jgi:hypothetical protein
VRIESRVPRKQFLLDHHQPLPGLQRKQSRLDQQSGDDG